MKTVLITGTSSGIGLATALELGRAGHKVYATMRNPARAPELGERARAEKLPISILTMDVDSDRSVSDCFAAVYRQDRNIDALVNNAGVAHNGTVEELPMEDFRAMMETNYFGALRCTRQVVARMRERGSGCIVNVTSVAGEIASSPLGGYAATKFALEALSETLAQEMKPFGVRVALVEPGVIDTPMARSVDNPVPSLYRQMRNMAALFQAALEHPTPPAVVAGVIRDVIESSDWKLRYPAGPDAEPFIKWRAAMTDEQWTEFNSLDAGSQGGLRPRPQVPSGGTRTFRVGRRLKTLAHASEAAKNSRNTILAADERGCTLIRQFVFNQRSSAFIRGRRCAGIFQQPL
jgi:NAD(P)-dependent dehydrogenase (short-subunit alcohol dehydrogenase family)